MKKVLMVAGRMHYGGLEMMLMSFFRNIDRTKISFDFMLNYDEEGFFDNEIKSLGGRIFIMPRLHPKNLFKYIYSVNKFFSEHKGEYDIIHGHLTSVGIIYLTLAKLHGIKTRIIHAHYAETKNNKFAKLEKILLFPLRFCADYYFACSNKAAKFCFGENIINKNKYHLIKNGIDTQRFIFNEAVRENKRKELNLDDKFAICHIGRFGEEKNHSFLIEVFKELIEIEKNAVLVLVGSGVLLEEIKSKVKSYNLQDSVYFLGARNDVFEIVQAVDIFVLPSFYEGLPVVSAEAQAAGLKCIFSDAITTEADITGNCKFLSLNSSAKAWVIEILSEKGYNRENMTRKIKNAGYDIKEQTKWLENFYISH
jgi:glycosyltransferase involved in cell wall biosynthesis